MRIGGLAALVVAMTMVPAGTAAAAEAPAAKRALRASFPSWLQDRSPLGGLPAGWSVAGYESAHVARVDAAGRTLLAASDEPLRLDLRLRRSKSGAHAAGDVVLPARLGSGIRVAPGLTLRPAGRNVAGALVDNAVVYAGARPGMDWAVTPTAGGVELLAQLRSRGAPSRLTASARGAEFGTPVAVDARGRAVKVTSRVRRGVLTLSVAHRAAKHPVLVATTVDAGARAADPGWAFTSRPAGAFKPAITPAGRTITAGRAPARGSTGLWAWTAPGATTFIPRAVFRGVQAGGATVQLGLGSQAAPTLAGSRTLKGAAARVALTADARAAKSRAATFALRSRGTAGLRSVLVFLDDPEPPVLEKPADTGWLRGGTGEVALQASDPGLGVRALRITGGSATTLDCDGTRARPCPAQVTRTLTYDIDRLPEGANALEAVAEDALGHRATARWTAKVDRTAPSVTLSGPLADSDGESVSAPSLALHVEAADALAGVEGIAIDVDGTRRGSTSDFVLDAAALPAGSHTVAVTVTDRAGNPTRRTLTFTTGSGGTAAPTPLPDTESGSLADTTSFLYTGPNAVQTGVAPGTIEQARAGVVRGRITTRGGDPLAGVRVSVVDHPELGETTTAENGQFSLAVNAGGTLTVRAERDGYLPSDRALTLDWNEYGWIDDIALVALDPQVTAIDLGSPLAPAQVARGTTTVDADGTRRATLIFPTGTQASLVMPDGTTQPLTDLHVRATEYTVGASGEEAMPAELPAQSGYTYAAEYSVDEAIAAGAAEVRFSQPVVSYTDNFLGFPVGMAVPTGSYDRAEQRWEGSDNGRVVALVGESDGRAELDVDGSGDASGQAQLDALGITDGELRRLAELYEPGDSLWRVPMEHFTPWDHNWPYGPPPGARGPDLWFDGLGMLDDCATCEGSVIEAENQVLGEELALAGTPHSLHYRSDRAAGFTGSLEETIPVTGDTVPAGVTRVDLTIEIAGRRFEESFAPAPDLEYAFQWDGKDAFGRRVDDTAELTARVSYVYAAARYASPAEFQRSFAQAGGDLLADPTRGEVALGQTLTAEMGTRHATPRDLGGWTLDSHHVYDPGTRTLHLGDGTRRSADGIAPAGGRIAGKIRPSGISSTSIRRAQDDPPSPLDFVLGEPSAVEAAPDGSLYVADPENDRVLRVPVSGPVETVAGIKGMPGLTGDGGPAQAARLDRPVDIALTDDGALLIADSDNERVRSVGTDGTITTVAGGGVGGDGGPAAEAALGALRAIAAAADGSFYVAGGDVIRRVTPDGVIQRIAGTAGDASFAGDGGPALDATFARIDDVDVAPDGSVYVADALSHRIRRIAPDGRIATVAGSGPAGSSGDGGPATEAELNRPGAVAVAPDGTVFVADTNNGRVRRVDTAGVITRVGGARLFGETRWTEGTAADAPTRELTGIAVAPNGDVITADAGIGSIYRMGPALPGFGVGDVLIPSADGNELFRFTAAGRHLETRDMLTGAVLETFGYDPSGALATVTDRYGEVTHIERDADGRPAAVVGPYGHRTTLELGAGGYLRTVADAAGVRAMEYGAGGLLTSFGEAGEASTFSYDAEGRLLRDESASGGSSELSRSSLARGRAVTLTTAEGRSTVSTVQELADGARRRTQVDSAGLTATEVSQPNGTTTTTLPDGTVIEAHEGGDPQFGSQVPMLTGSEATTPGGLTQSFWYERDVEGGGASGMTELTEWSTLEGATTETHYDGATRTITEKSPEGREATTVLDAKGRVIREQTGGRPAREYRYDARGRLEEEEHGGRLTRYTYDAKGRMATVTDPEDRTWQYEYDAADRLTAETAPDGTTTRYRHDASGRVVGVTPPGRDEHEYGRSGDRRTSYTPPGASAPTIYEHDLDGRLEAVERPDAGRIEFDLDAAGRVSGVTEPGRTTQLEYEPGTGNLAAVSDSKGQSVDYAYDGSLVTGEVASGGVDASIEYGYDTFFRVSSVAVDGAPLGMGYDLDGLLTSAGALQLSRDPVTGQVAGTQLDGVTTTMAYDGYGAPASRQAVSPAGSVLETSYVRDSLGRIAGLTETDDQGTHELAFAYDAVGRLTTVTRDGDPYASYAYDDNGNRVASDDPGRGARAVTYDGRDRIVQVGPAVHEYDDAGRLKRAGDTDYAYDAAGNLIGVELADGPDVEYVVDALDRPVARRVDGDVQSRFAWGSQVLGPLAEKDADGQLVSRFVYGARGFVPEYMERGGRRFQLVTDHLGSVRAVVDSQTGDVEQRIDYDPYGRVLRDTNPGFQPFGYAGGLTDPDTGLVRFGARHYDPEVGRWLTVDPIDFGGGDTNLYAYVLGDPVNLADPTGLIFGVGWDDISNCVSGFGDSVSYGGTRWVRKKMGTDGVVDHGSGCYKAGTTAGDLYPTKRVSGVVKSAKRCITSGGKGEKKRVVVKDGKIVRDKPQETKARVGDKAEQRKRDEEFLDKVRNPRGESKRVKRNRNALDLLKDLADSIGDMFDG